MEQQFRILEIRSGGVLVQSPDDVDIILLRIPNAQKYVENEIIRAEAHEDDSLAGWSGPVVVASSIDPSLIGESAPQLVDCGGGDFEMSEVVSFEDSEPFQFALELYRAGDTRQAGRQFRSFLTDHPLHIDSYHHLGLLESDRSRVGRALKYYETGYRIGLLSLPKDFAGRLQWGFLGNRPFLRAAHGYGLTLERKRRWLDACEVYERMLEFNPNDNQGVRYLLPEAYLHSRSEAKAKEALDRTDVDGMNLYTRCLLEIVEGRSVEALRWMCRGLSHNRHFPGLVLDERPQPGRDEAASHVTMGGADEARDYLRRLSRHWRKAAPRRFLTRVLSAAELKDRLRRAQELEDSLEGLPVGDRRSRIVDELFSTFAEDAIPDIVSACRSQL